MPEVILGTAEWDGLERARRDEWVLEYGIHVRAWRMGKERKDCKEAPWGSSGKRAEQSAKQVLLALICLLQQVKS